MSSSRDDQASKKSKKDPTGVEDYTERSEITRIVKENDYKSFCPSPLDPDWHKRFDEAYFNTYIAAVKKIRGGYEYYLSADSARKLEAFFEKSQSAGDDEPELPENSLEREIESDIAALQKEDAFDDEVELSAVEYAGDDEVERPARSLEREIESDIAFLQEEAAFADENIEDLKLEGFESESEITGFSLEGNIEKPALESEQAAAASSYYDSHIEKEEQDKLPELLYPGDGPKIVNINDDKVERFTSMIKRSESSPEPRARRSSSVGEGRKAESFLSKIKRQRVHAADEEFEEVSQDDIGQEEKGTRTLSLVSFKGALSKIKPKSGGYGRIIDGSDDVGEGVGRK
ncbi:hypothetical protein N9W34_02475 [Rickettsiales bacterium]|nr:hypothetical protein [Rickettsiales bacterium]